MLRRLPMSLRTALAFLLAQLLCASALGQAYGGFLPGQPANAPGITVTADGFRVSDSNGSLFRFYEPAGKVTLTQATARTAQWTFEGPRSAPKAVSANSWAPGLELTVNQGFRVRLSTLARPLVSVPGATFDGAPTPRVPWVLISFRDPEPALLLSFRGQVSDVRVEGSPGEWVLRLRPAFEGPIRIAAPFGQLPPPGSGPLVGRLGDLVAAAERHAQVWVQPAPRVLRYTVLSAPGALDLNWTFDRAGAVIPPAIVLATTQAGVQILSPFQVVSPAFVQGPLALVQGTQLRVRVPARLLPRGRALTAGPWTQAAASQPGAMFIAAAPWDLLAAERQAIADAYRAAPRAPHPLLGTQGFGAADEPGWAALAGLASRQARVLASQSESSQANLALTSLLWARDPWTLLAPGGPAANADAAAAGLLATDLQRQGDGALSGLGVLGLAARPAHIRSAGLAFDVPPAPIPEQLSSILGIGGRIPEWGRVSKSPLWLRAGPPAWVTRAPNGWLLTWRTRGPGLAAFDFAPGPAFTAQPVLNLSSAEPGTAPDGGQTLRARSQEPGVCQVLLTFPNDEGLEFPPTAPPAPG